MITQLEMKVLANFTKSNNLEINSVSKLARDINTTIPHAFKMIRVLKKLGIVETKRIGRRRFLFLNKKYEELAKACNTLILLENSLIHIEENKKSKKVQNDKK